MFDIWMRLLQQVEGSVLWMSATNAVAQANLCAEAKARDVPRERLVFAERIDRARYFERLSIADLFLDTLPYNAHTTASDALWAGVPVITCSGQGFAARVAGSQLAAIGMPELIATNLADYETLALELARSPERLAAIRAKLSRNRASHPLFNTALLCRNIEGAYETMWDIWQRGDSPRSFSVTEMDTK
jgi:predicted O-linked N-acetylglucosamine transferase (SPINDLY family)